MNQFITIQLDFFRKKAECLFLLVFLILFCIPAFSQAPKKKHPGPSPNTKDNTNYSQPKQKKSASNTPDNATISQPGDNKRFPSNKNSTTSNPGFKTNKSAVKKKQETNAKFSGNDQVKKADRLSGPPPGEKVKGKVSSPVDQSGYSENRDKSFKAGEKPHDLHDFQGEVVIKKNSHLDGSKQAAEVDHTGRKSEMVDHSKYKNYRKSAFEKRESDYEHLNSQGSSQYGLREEEGIDLEKRKALRESKDRQRAEYSGNMLPKVLKPTGSTYTGDIDVTNKEKKEKDTDKEHANYTGDVDLRDREKKAKAGEKERAEYAGDVDLRDKEKQARIGEKERAEYSGDINLEARDKMRRAKQKEIAENTGDISMNAVMKKAREMRKKEKTISKYSGDILVKTVMARERKNRIKAKKIANWEGDIVVAKRRKGSHPSSAYAGGKVANSYKAREKYRKKMLKKYGRNPGIETPNYQRRKYEKPTYDKNEGKIWDVQKYKESKTKEAQ